MNEDRIARAVEVIGEQLTRIADQGEPTRIVFAKKPAPDVEGLVGICIDTIARLGLLANIPEGTQLSGANCTFIKNTRASLESALAAFKPEVADGS